MITLFVCTLTYFLLGCAVIVFSVWPKGNKFIQFIDAKFASHNSFNRWLADFFEYLKTYHPNKLDKLPLLLIAVADYQAQRINVIDPLISLLALTMKVQIIINS